MEEGQFRVVKASAGSGKTYALVSAYIAMALGNSRPEYYRHILAITFTNAAAVEMKERVLKLLRKISESDPDTQALSQTLATQIGIDQIELARRAAGTYRHMLHHYGLLSISTIDSFTHRLVRSFSRDLKISHDFNVQLDADEFMEAVTDTCLNLIGEDEDLTAYFRQFTFDELREEKSWNPRESILNITRELLKEEASISLEKLKDFSLEDFTAIRKKLQKQQEIYKNTLGGIAKKAIFLLENRGLELKDFAHSGSGTITVFHKIIKEDYTKPPGPRFYEISKSGDWGKKGIAPDKKNSINEISAELSSLAVEAGDLIDGDARSRYFIRNAILAKINSIGLLHELHRISEQYKQEENLLLIKDFHELIGRIVEENDAPFIYERIGHRYRHLLIDEFQDTSAKQWSNMVPLIVNALGENNLNLVVGDAKQSIYRWRGGRAEQFVNLPEIDITGVHRLSGEAFRHHFREENLAWNYRSGKSIVQFNNQLYSELTAQIPFAEKIYAGHEQAIKRTTEGLVEIIKSASEDKAERWERTSTLILDCIQRALHAGYRPGDIAILTRKGNKEAGPISQLLTENGYQIATLESLLIQNSPMVQAISGYMHYLLDHSDNFAILQVIQGVSAVHPNISYSDFLERHLSFKDKKLTLDFESWLLHHFETPFTTPRIGDPLSIATSLLAYFRFTTDEFVEFFLEIIRKRNGTGNNSLIQWNAWWKKNAHRQYISTSPDPQAIRIMTIHKSKGLQFPVVIYPQFASGHPAKEIWVDLDPEIYGLPTALIRPKSEIAEDVPEMVLEKNKELLDDMNLCYVATTRAEDYLFIIAEKGARPTEFQKIFDQVITTSFEFCKQSEEHWVMGTMPSGVGKTDEPLAIPMKHRYQRTAEPAFRAVVYEESDDQPDSYGRRLHEVLAAIVSDDILPAQLEQLVHSKTTDADVAQKLMRDVQAVLAGASSFGWFEKSKTIFCEREILARDGRLFRPDRVVLHETHIDLIDYKTGVEREEHQHQIREYSSLLQSIYKKEVRANLVYVQDEVHIRTVEP